jgi:hypothetical protein
VSLVGWLSRQAWPVRTALSVWWAQWFAHRMPVPQCRNVAEVRAIITDLIPHYRADPAWMPDYSEDPRRIEWARIFGRLADLPGFDCDDFALHGKALTWELDPTGLVWVLVSAGPWSHCVYEFRAEGTRWVLDTNGVTRIPEGETVAAFVQRTYYPAANYEDAYTVPYPFPDPRKVA